MERYQVQQLMDAANKLVGLSYPPRTVLIKAKQAEFLKIKTVKAPAMPRPRDPGERSQLGEIKLPDNLQVMSEPLVKVKLGDMHRACTKYLESNPEKQQA